MAAPKKTAEAQVPDQVDLGKDEQPVKLPDNPATPKVIVSGCFITGCESQGIHDVEAKVPGGVGIDVKVCDDHYEQLKDAQKQSHGVGKGVCHICKQPVGVLTQKDLIENPNATKGEDIIVSWWVHSTSKVLCHEDCVCADEKTGREVEGYTRDSALVPVRAVA